MKKIILAAIAVSIATMFTGCAEFSTTNKQVMTTQTIFGFQLAANPNQGITGVIPQVQFGLIRSHYVSNPTATNPVYAAPISSVVNANLGVLSQTATENESLGK